MTIVVILFMPFWCSCSQIRFNYLAF